MIDFITLGNNDSIHGGRKTTTGPGGVRSATAGPPRSGPCAPLGAARHALGPSSPRRSLSMSSSSLRWRPAHRKIELEPNARPHTRIGRSCIGPIASRWRSRRTARTRLAARAETCERCARPLSEVQHDADRWRSHAPPAAMSELNAADFWARCSRSHGLRRPATRRPLRRSTGPACMLARGRPPARPAAWPLMVEACASRSGAADATDERAVRTLTRDGSTPCWASRCLAGGRRLLGAASGERYAC